MGEQNTFTHQLVTFDFDFQRLTDFYLGRHASDWKVCFYPKKLKKAVKKSRHEQLYVHLRDEEPPEVVWKRLGQDTVTFMVDEVEDMVVSTKPPLGGTKVVVKLVEKGEKRDLLYIHGLKDPETFVDTIKDMQGDVGGKMRGGPKRESKDTGEQVAHATTHIVARDPSVSEPCPSVHSISPRLVRGQAGAGGEPRSSNNHSNGPVSAAAPSMSAASGMSGARAMKKQGSVSGEPYSNPLFAHGKIRYHMVLPEAVPPALFHTRPEVDALISTGPNKPVQQLLREEEQQKLLKEQEDMRLSPSRAHSHLGRPSPTPSTSTHAPHTAARSDPPDGAAATAVPAAANHAAAASPATQQPGLSRPSYASASFSSSMHGPPVHGQPPHSAGSHHASTSAPSPSAVAQHQQLQRQRPSASGTSFSRGSGSGLPNLPPAGSLTFAPLKRTSYTGSQDGAASPRGPGHLGAIRPGPLMQGLANSSFSRTPRAGSFTSMPPSPDGDAGLQQLSGSGRASMAVGS